MADWCFVHVRAGNERGREGCYKERDGSAIYICVYMKALEIGI